MKHFLSAPITISIAQWPPKCHADLLSAVGQDCGFGGVIIFHREALALCLRVPITTFILS